MTSVQLIHLLKSYVWMSLTKVNPPTHAKTKLRMKEVWLAITLCHVLCKSHHHAARQWKSSLSCWLPLPGLKELGVMDNFALHSVIQCLSEDIAAWETVTDFSFTAFSASSMSPYFHCFLAYLTTALAIWEKKHINYLATTIHTIGSHLLVKFMVNPFSAAFD